MVHRNLFFVNYKTLTAHKSRIFIQPYETPFNVETTQIFPGTGIYTMILAAVSQMPDAAHNPVQSTSPRL